MKCFSGTASIRCTPSKTYSLPPSSRQNSTLIGMWRIPMPRARPARFPGRRRTQCSTSKCAAWLKHWWAIGTRRLPSRQPLSQGDLGLTPTAGIATAPSLHLPSHLPRNLNSCVSSTHLLNNLTPAAGAGTPIVDKRGLPQGSRTAHPVPRTAPSSLQARHRCPQPRLEGRSGRHPKD